MTTTLASPSSVPARRSAPGVSRRRRLTNTIATAAVYGAVVVAAAPLGLLVYFVVRRGAQAVSWQFLTAAIPTTRRVGPGVGPAVAGTLLTTAIATLLAVPLGVLGAVYLNEYGKQSRAAGVLRFLANVLSGVPSIVMGLFIYTIYVLRFTGEGRTAFAGSLALACLMLPVIIRSTEEMLRLVPVNLREASLALGASQSRTICTVVLPAALPGITSGALLAVARAAGETAPVLFTIGFTQTTNWNPLKGPNTTLAQFIFNNAGQPFPGAVERAWGAAFTLIALVLLLTVTARIVANRFAVR